MSAIFARHYLLWILAGLLLVFLLIWGGYRLWRSRKRSKRQGDFKQGFLGLLDGFRMGRDPEDAADLEDLKRKFSTLIDTLEDSNQKDIYEMPWFLIIGPSGAGKSWALKGIRLEPLNNDVSSAPPDRLTARDGRRGTVLMDWWKGENEFVLDTAGGTVFPEEKALDSPEWTALLGLLRQHRPECPINGLFVVIPAEMLLLDAKDLPPGSLTLEDYAVALRSQIKDRLVKGLKLRFPVYFLVTKGDKIPGFREFADEIEGAKGAGASKFQPVDQLLGWSNPAKVGKQVTSGSQPKRAVSDTEGFDPTAVADYLHEVAADVRCRRLALLEKYAQAGAESEGMVVRRRAAELFAFADAIETIVAPRLRGFLEAVFQRARLDPLPPFVRGIYLTSAMREGEVLDPLRARAVGKTLSQLAMPGGTDRNVKKAFFLKDLFYKKAFREYGLVIPMVSARKYLVSRRRSLIWSGIGGATLLLIALIVGFVSYGETIAGKRRTWQKVADQTNQVYWLPVVEQSGEGYILNPATIMEQQRLAGDASDLNPGFFAHLFGPGKLKDDLRKAQLKLFRRGVMQPLADYARQKVLATNALSAPTPDELRKQLERYEAGFLALLELELAPANQTDDAKIIQSGNRILDNLVRFLVLNSPAAKDTDDLMGALRTTFKATYCGEPSRRSQWPPKEARDPARFTLLVNTGLAELGRLHGQQLQGHANRRREIEEEVKQAGALLDSEKRLMEAIRDRKEDEQLAAIVGSLCINWEARTNFLAQRPNLTSALTNLFAEVARDSDQKRAEFAKRLREVPGVVPLASTNGGAQFIAPLQDAFSRHLEGAAWAAQIGRVTSLSLSLKVQMEKSDRELFAIAPASGQSDFSGPPTRPFDQRLSIYESITGNPSDLLSSLQVVPRSTPPAKDEMEKYLEDNLRSVRQGVPNPAAFAGLSLPLAPARGLPYLNVISNFLGCLFVEQSVTTWSNGFLANLPKVASVTNSPRASAVLVEASRAAGKILGVSNAVDRVLQVSKLTDIHVRTGASDDLDKIRQAVGNRQYELADALKARLVVELPDGLPFDSNASPENRAAVVKAKYDQTTEWRTAWENKLNDDQRASLDGLFDQETDRIRNRIADMEKRFDDIIEPPKPGAVVARFQRYELLFAGPKELASFQGQGAGGGVDQERARVDAGYYRSWRFRGERAIDPGNAWLKPTSIGEFGANEQFEVKVKRDTNWSSPDPELPVSVPPAWTVIGLIKKQGSRGGNGEWLVPLDVEDGLKKTGRIWIVIRKVQPDHR